MALHQNLPIYKVAYDLFNLVTDLVRNMPRDFKQSIGAEINRECLRVVVLIARANSARDNLSSQFFANVYLNALDQFVKHQIGAKHYIRYVDDFVLLHESPQWLNTAHDIIRDFLPARLDVRLNPSKTILQPVDRGVDFVGHVIKPWHRSTRRRTVNEAVRRIRQTPADELLEVGNSYFGLLRQAEHSHHDRTRLANVLRDRGHTINGDITKTYRRTPA